MIAASSADEIIRFANILRDGGIGAVPTETVYGLAADANNGTAVARIYETKGRPRFNPLIVHVADGEMAAEVADLDHCAAKLMSRFWPGPLSLVLPLAKNAAIADLVTAGLETVAVRAPAHPVAQDLLAALGRPFVAPSANRSGRISPTTAAHVRDEFGETVAILDGGPSSVGLESTIVSLHRSRPTLLRPGGIPTGEIEAVLGHPLLPPGDTIEAPGMLASHYAPRVPVRMNVEQAMVGESLLGFGGTPNATLDLSPTGDLVEAAANLFGYLRQLDELGHPIAVAPLPEHGLGEALNDRLRRAATR